MNLLPKYLLKRFQQVGRQEHSQDPIIIAKYFSPSGSYTFFATEFDQNSRRFFGFTQGLGSDEWGYTSLDEMLQVRCPPFGLPVERDLYFKEQRFSEVKLLPTYA